MTTTVTLLDATNSLGFVKPFSLKHYSSPLAYWWSDQVAQMGGYVCRLHKILIRLGESRLCSVIQLSKAISPISPLRNSMRSISRLGVPFQALIVPLLRNVPDIDRKSVPDCSYVKPESVRQVIGVNLGPFWPLTTLTRIPKFVHKF